MESGSDGQLRRQIGNYPFLENLGRGELSHAYMAMENRGDANIDAFISSAHPPGPAEALFDLQLPEALFGNFLSLLPNLGHVCRRETEVSRSGPRQYTHVQLRNAQGNRILIYIPDWIITDPNPENLSAITALSTAFKQDSFLIVFHNERPDPQIRQIIENDWSRYKGCKLWSRQDLEDIKSRPQMQELLINGVLGI